MDASVGIDISEVSEVEAALERFGERYLRRIFTPEERRSAGTGPGSAARLAMCFAVKEATMKALELEAGAWRSVGLVRGARGVMHVELSPAVAADARCRGLTVRSVSACATRRYAAAVVLAERRAGGR